MIFIRVFDSLNNYNYFEFTRLIRHYVEEDDAASVITSEEGSYLKENIHIIFIKSD